MVFRKKAKERDNLHCLQPRDLIHPKLKKEGVMRIWFAALCFMAWATFACAVEQAEPPTVEQAAPKTVEQPSEPGMLTGRVVMENKSSSTVIISIFGADSGPPPDQGAVRRVPEGLLKVSPDGNFKVKLAPGRYYLGVVSRAESRRLGPPGPDEEYFFVRDAKGDLRVFEVVAGVTEDIGSLMGTAPESFPDIEHYFTVEGTILDEQGKPFGGVLILVRSDLATPRPLFISERTGADGRYRLKLPADQPVYLVVRENLINVGRPLPGNIVGTYGGSAPRSGEVPSIFLGGKPVLGAEGTVLKGMDITVYKIPDPEALKSTFQAQSQSVTPPGNAVRRPPKP